MFPLTEDEYNFIYWCIDPNGNAPQEMCNVAYEILIERELLLTNKYSMSGTATGIMKDDEHS